MRSTQSSQSFKHSKPSPSQREIDAQGDPNPDGTLAGHDSTFLSSVLMIPSQSTQNPTSGQVKAPDLRNCKPTTASFNKTFHVDRRSLFLTRTSRRRGTRGRTSDPGPSSPPPLRSGLDYHYISFFTCRSAESNVQEVSTSKWIAGLLHMNFQFRAERGRIVEDRGDVDPSASPHLPEGLYDCPRVCRLCVCVRLRRCACLRVDRLCGGVPVGRVTAPDITQCGLPLLQGK